MKMLRISIIFVLNVLIDKIPLLGHEIIVLSEIWNLIENIENEDYPKRCI